MSVEPSETVLERFLSESEWAVADAAQVSALAGERFCVPGDQPVLAYVFTGAVTLTQSERTVDLATGDLLLLTAASGASLRAREVSEVLVAHIDPVRSPSGARPLPDAVLLTDFAQRECAVARLLDVIGTPVGISRAGDDLVCSRIATTILTVAIRLWATQGCAPAGWPARVADPFLGRALEAIHDDLSREWTVAELAGISAMSRSAFAARFRADLGQSPLGYVTTARMEAAKDLLVQGTSVSESSRMLGFASDEGFRRAFRRHTGTAPSRWRDDGRAVANSAPPMTATTPAMTPSVPAP